MSWALDRVHLRLFPGQTLQVFGQGLKICQDISGQVQTQDKWTHTSLRKSPEAENMDVTSHPGVCRGAAHGVMPRQRRAQGGAKLPGVGAMLAACTAQPSAPA